MGPPGKAPYFRLNTVTFNLLRNDIPLKWRPGRIGLETQDFSMAGPLRTPRLSSGVIRNKNDIVPILRSKKGRYNEIIKVVKFLTIRYK